MRKQIFNTEKDQEFKNQQSTSPKSSRSTGTIPKIMSNKKEKKQKHKEEPNELMSSIRSRIYQKKADCETKFFTTVEDEKKKLNLESQELNPLTTALTPLKIIQDMSKTFEHLSTSFEMQQKKQKEIKISRNFDRSNLFGPINLALESVKKKSSFLKTSIQKKIFGSNSSVPNSQVFSFTSTKTNSFPTVVYKKKKSKK
jgi:hypothetical protein